MSVGVIVHDLDDQERKEAYNCDITYGTNNEYGFDYLRDNMKFRIEDCVQRGHHFGIVDEVDSILIDEARTPLIISGPSEESTDKYYKVNRIIPKLVRGEVNEGKEPGEKYTTGDFTVDEKHRAVGLTEEGVTKVEKLLSGLPISFDDTREQVVYEMAKCLSESRWVSRGLYDRAVEALGHVGITDVITLMGHYTSVSMTLAFYDVPAGAPGMAR